MDLVHRVRRSGGAQGMSEQVSTASAVPMKVYWSLFTGSALLRCYWEIGSLYALSLDVAVFRSRGLDGGKDLLLRVVDI